MANNHFELLRTIYRLLANGDKLTYAALGVGLLVAILYFRIFFRNPSGFKEDVIQSEKIPLLDRDYDPVESNWSGNKITIWVLISVGCSIAAYYQLPDWFPHVFKAP
jgi:hypothetical protein